MSDATTIVSNIKYKTYPNDFLDGEELYRASIVSGNTITLDELFETMSFHHSTLTVADMQAFHTVYKQAILRALLEGKRIQTDLMSFKLSMRGVFNGPEDYFDPKRHELVILIRPDSDFQDLVRLMANFEKQRAIKPQPELHKYINLRKGASNTVLSPSYNGRIEGYNLSFNEDDPQQGLFLIATSGHTNAGIEIRLEDLSLATSTKIIFRTPDDLIPGPYKVEMRAIFGKDKMRIGVLGTILQVE
ncbi:MAG: DUF4469 domain-containing protein [Anaerolineae bacterium]|nr:DUF4469 domain-containing protein [Anaerolineae bacterium]